MIVSHGVKSVPLQAVERNFSECHLYDGDCNTHTSQGGWEPRGSSQGQERTWWVTWATLVDG